MANLIKLEEAARLLGISPEKLTELRSRNEIFGYRDGANWKFKLEELERVARDQGLGFGGKPPAPKSDEIVDLGDLDDLVLEDASPDVLSLEDDGKVDSDSILVSEEELGKSDDTTASTIIGEENLLGGGESDVRLTGKSEGGSELRLAADSKAEAAEDEVELAASDILSDEGEKPASPSDTARLQPLSGSGDELSMESGSGSLDLSLEDLETEGEATSGSELKLQGDAKASSSSGFGSAIDLELDDEELVLGSGSGSDVTSGAADSGINLNHPSDSGLSLEEPLELSTGSGVESLELGEDDLAELDKVGGKQGKASQPDDDFLLTPVDGGIEDEGESGSQVIDLDSEEFDDSAAALLSPQSAPALEEETVEFAEVDADATPAGLAGTGAAVGIAPAMDGSEAPYTIWNVLSLFFVALVLGFTGILMLDLMNNIWSWDGNYEFNSQIMDAILNLLPGS